MAVRSCLLVAFVAAACSAARAADAVDFDRQIRPILSDKCFFCHGPDKKQRQADLRLDLRDAAIEAGAIVPGKPDTSELVRRVLSDDPDEMMPPPEAHKELSERQKELLKNWVAAGAEYEVHWAYRPLARPSVPLSKSKPSAWIRNPIDAFVLADLAAKKLGPSREADKSRLLRRVSLDLIGLPPTPEEVRAFLADTRPDAYERQVDRLLASPHFGERMAIPWLDVVRFSDTVGYHGDQRQNIFPYRDYVIDAFNSNKPFDQFTIEQLAGDLLPHPTTAQHVATGFNRLNMMTREGGAQPKEYLAKYAADRVRTVAATWLGSTMGCCECHDHKFDPFTSRDFYSLAAFFADVKQWGYYADARYAPTPELKGFGNEHPFPPEIELTSRYLVQRQRQLETQMAELADAAMANVYAAPKPRAALAVWQHEMAAFLDRSPDGWSSPRPTIVEPEQPPGHDAKQPGAKPGGKQAAASATVAPDGRVLFGLKPSDDVIRLPLDVPWLAALRLELRPDARHKGSILRAGESTLVLPTARLRRASKTPRLNFRHADADHLDPRYSNGYALTSVRTGWKTSSKRASEPQTSVWLFDRPVRVQPGDELELSFAKNAIGCLRVSVSPLAAIDPLDGSLASRLRASLSSDAPLSLSSEHALANLAYLAGTAYDPQAFDRFHTLHGAWAECRRGRAETMVTVAREPRTTRILPRGNWQDDSGDVVEPAVPGFLPQPSRAASTASEPRLTRLDLARWLVSPENPLTSRVIVNRLWKQVFGAGLSSVVDDLGAQGEPPSHPELLDWLACEFRGGWDTKRLMRLLVTSATYRQDSSQRVELKEIDPNNCLLAYHNPRRLEAELVRDNALAIAGLLNLDVGGPSARPYQPAGYYANLQFPNRDYFPQLDDRQYRRGLYTHWQRTFLHPMMANFDAPSREECTATRVVSNTPQQALTLLNDPTFVEAARAMAARLLAGPKLDDDRRLDRAYELALARQPLREERESLRRFVTAQRSYYLGHAAEATQLAHVGIAAVPAGIDAAELAAWSTVCRVILNLQETITRY
jgi:hypothetical protein